MQARAGASIWSSERQRMELERVARSRRTPQAVAQRARIVLLTADGMAPSKTGREVGLAQPAIRKWRLRYVEDVLAGLRNELRPGRPRALDDQRLADLPNEALRTRPAKQAHCGVRNPDTEAGVSRDMVHGLFSATGVQPHRARSFELSNDPQFVEKRRDFTGRYLNPPEHALVLCVDEERQVQALQRTRPLLPMRLGYVEGVTRDYLRHGTATLFAALKPASGEVIHHVRAPPGHQECLDFLRQIDEQTPPGLGLSLVLGNLASQMHTKVGAWLARHSRFGLNFKPTCSSWLNAVERWFAMITERAIRCGSFKRLRRLWWQSGQPIRCHNASATSSTWVAAAESIRKQIERLAKRFLAAGHQSAALHRTASTAR